jgi:hypothetical protein
VSVDWGSCTNFVEGKYPSYTLKPLNNASDPGVCNVVTYLRDDNPQMFFVNYTFKVIVLPLKPLPDVIAALASAKNDTTAGKVNSRQKITVI